MPSMPWERRAQEPGDAYSHFLLYRNLGPARSLADAADPCGLSIDRLKQLSSSWQWHSRAQMWDRFCQQQRRDDEIQSLQESRRRQRQEADDFLQLARARFQDWVRRGEDGELELMHQLSVPQALQLYRTGYDAESALRGLDGMPHGARSPEEELRLRLHSHARQLRAAVLDAVVEMARLGAAGPEAEGIEDDLYAVIAASPTLCDEAGTESAEQSLLAGPRFWPWNLPFAEA